MTIAMRDAGVGLFCDWVNLDVASTGCARQTLVEGSQRRLRRQGRLQCATVG